MIEELASAWKMLVYAFRGGQAEAMDEIRRYENLLRPLCALGANVPARIHDAGILEACAVPSEAVIVFAKTFATGRFTAEDLAQLQRLGIVAPMVDRSRRMGSAQ